MRELNQEYSDFVIGIIRSEKAPADQKFHSVESFMRIGRIYKFDDKKVIEALRELAR